jgi:hypothetical protein
MSTELFDQPDQCNPIMPYDPVVNRLSFFSVSLFDHEFKILDTDPPLPSQGSPSSFQGMKILKLGLPISDLFPETLPEAPTVVIERNGQKFRVSSNGMMLPAKTNNRRFSDGIQVELRGNRKGITGPDTYKNLIKNFTSKENDLISAGLPVTRISNNKILRFSANQSMRQYMIPSLGSSQNSTIVKIHPPEDPSTLSDEDYFEACTLLFDDSPSSKFDLDGL